MARRAAANQYSGSVDIEVDGKSYSGTYGVNGDWVSLTSAYGSRGTQVGNSSAEAVARRLLHDLVADFGAPTRNSSQP